MSLARPAGIRNILAVVAVAAGMVAVFVAVPAAGAQTAVSAISYINPDTGSPSENADVSSSSSCATPVRNDPSQEITADPSVYNVHNDACLLDSAGAKIDVPAAFTVSGVGVVHACPDPDGPGPKTAAINGKSCILSGYEDANMEYHARIIASGPGDAAVTFCADPEGNGCVDATVSNQITITFVAAGAQTTTTLEPVAVPADGGAPAGGVATGIAPGGHTPLLVVAAAGVFAALAAAVVTRRRVVGD